MSKEHVKEWQTEIGAFVDGDFGPRTLELSFAHGEREPIPSIIAPWTLRESDLTELATVEAPLARVVQEAARRSKDKFGVYEGIRTAERQRELFSEGRSDTLHSRHLTGHAVDLVWRNRKGHFDWSNVAAQARIIDVMLEVAKEQGYPLYSLGRAKGWDYYHFQRRWGQ